MWGNELNLDKQVDGDSAMRYAEISNNSIAVFGFMIAGAIIIGVAVGVIYIIVKRVKMISKLEEYTGNTVGKVTMCQSESALTGSIRKKLFKKRRYKVAIEYKVDDNRFFINEHITWPVEKGTPEDLIIKYSMQNPKSYAVEFRTQKYES